MSATSVLTVEVQSEEFDALMREIEQFQEIAGQFPKEFQDMTKRIDKMFDGSIAGVRKVGEESKKQVKNVGLFERAWDQVAKKTKGMKDTITGLGKSINTLIPGLGMAGLFAGGLLGIPAALFAAFAGSQSWASSGRTQNMALGTSQGNREAFLNQFSTYGMGEGNLSTLEEEKTDYRKAGALALATGMSQEQARNMDTTELVIAAMQKIKGDQASGNIASARMRSEAAGFSPAQFQNIMAHSQEELDSDIKQMRDRAKSLELGDKDQRNAQDFTRTMDDLFNNFKTSFFKITESLQVPITNLVTSFKTLFESLSKSGKLKEWMDDLGKGLEKFGNYLNSKDFPKDLQTVLDDIRDFGETVKAIGQSIYAGLDKLGLIDHDKNLSKDQQDAKDKDKKWGGWSGAAAGAAAGAAIGSAGLGVGAIPGAVIGGVAGYMGGRAWGDHVFHWTNEIPQGGNPDPAQPAPAQPGPTNAAANGKDPIGITAFTADRITGVQGMLARTLRIESHGDPSAVSPKGARGFLQWMPDTAKQYGVTIGDMESEKAGWVKYYAYLMNKFHDARKAAAAYNWGEGNVQKDINRHGADWYSYLPAETKNYVNVVVDNRTGADISTGLAGNSYMPAY